jgi:hypothetical protein
MIEPGKVGAWWKTFRQHNPEALASGRRGTYANAYLLARRGGGAACQAENLTVEPGALIQIADTKLDVPDLCHNCAIRAHCKVPRLLTSN